MAANQTDNEHGNQGKKEYDLSGGKGGGGGKNANLANTREARKIIPEIKSRRLYRFTEEDLDGRKRAIKKKKKKIIGKKGRAQGQQCL